MTFLEKLIYYFVLKIHVKYLINTDKYKIIRLISNNWINHLRLIILEIHINIPVHHIYVYM